jgi:hypothetical protein
MKTFLIINNKEITNYETTKVKIKTHDGIIPRKGERITANNESYDVISIHYDYDKKEVSITVK